MTDRFETRTVHAGAEPDPHTGAVVPAIQMSTTFKQDGVGGLRGGGRTVCDHGGIPLCPGEPYFHLRLFAADLLDDARFLHFRAGAGRLEFSRIWNYLSDGNFHVCI